MEKDIAVLEIRNNEAILVIGNFFNNKLNITKVLSRPLSISIKDGAIIDPDSLTKDIKSMLVIEDKKNKIKFNINEITLVLEPYGLLVYNSSKSTIIVSQSSTVERIDISNVLSMIKKEKLDNENNLIVDIVPNYFLIDGNQKFVEPPIGKISTQLSLNGNIYSLPISLVQNLMECVQAAGVKIKRNVIAPIGVAELLKSLNYTTDIYVLADCGRKNAALTFVGKSVVYNSTFISIGYDDLLDDISNELQILRSEAENLVNLYGYDNRKSLLNPIISKANINNQIFEYHQEDLNKIILKFFKRYIEIFENAFDVVAGNNKRVINNIIFTGELSKVNGFKDFVCEHFKNIEADFPILPIIGVEDPVYMNCAGAVVVSSSYKGTLEDDFKGKIKDLGKEKLRRETYSETKDEL